MSYKIDEVEGIGPAYAEKLSTVGIQTTADFLKLCCDAKGRKDVAEKTGIAEGSILNWANQADLMRISGIGPQYAEILRHAGVDTVKELQHRNPDNLTAKMEEVNQAKNLANANPSTSVVGGWIEAAKNTPPTITH